MDFYIWTPTLSGNMFVVYDFTYKPLNFRENMFAVHNFPKKDLELRNNPLENPNVYEF
jgi:hypothetical protein